MVEWRPIPGFEEFYEVSNEGAVRSLSRPFIYSTGTKIMRPGRILRPRKVTGGHLRVALSDGVRRADFLVHRLVLLAFVGEPRPGQVACHYNDVPEDNRIGNLRWDTRRANAFDAYRNGHRVLVTHCRHGHEYSEENTYHNSGRRHCRACKRDWDRTHG